MRYTLIPFTLPQFLFGYGYVLLVTILGMAKGWSFDKENWVLEAQWRDWLLKPRKFLQKIKWPFGRFFDEEGKPTTKEMSVMRSWWKYSTTVGYGMIFQPNVSPRTRKHEVVHTRQGQDESFRGFWIGLIVGIGFWAHGDVGAGFAWWMCVWLSSFAWRTTNSITAKLRGGHLYRDAEHERSAYAQTDRWPNGESWIEDHAKRKQDW